MTALAPDDVVATRAAAIGNARAPLVVLDALRAFLDAHAIGSGDELVVEPLGDGHSNVTLLVRRGAAEVVLRRPPRGPLPPSAHDVVREARLLRALAGSAARVPRVLAICDDAAVVGAPFFLMERLRGEVIAAALPAALDAPAQRRRVGEQLVDALVAVHAIDWRACGLDALAGDPERYLERQLERFAGLWQHSATDPVPAVTRVAAWLRAHRPRSAAPTVVHGDARLGNALFAPDPPARLVALLDWEMATIGDPLADVGYLCALWAEADDPPDGLLELSSVTRAAGFPTRDELVARYATRSGRSVDDIRWYRVLALWKAAIFMQGNVRRARAGSTDDPYLKRFAGGVAELAARAEALAHAPPA